jgi:hypothetical protein
MARGLSRVKAMKAPVLFLLGGAVAAISCNLAAGGLNGTATEGQSADGGPSGQRIGPASAGFEGVPDDAANLPTPPDADAPPADASPMSPAGMVQLPADAAPAPAPAPTPPDAAPAAATPAPTVEPRVLRVHDLKVGRLTARVVHAHQLEFASGSAGVVLPGEDDALLMLELPAKNDLEVPELTVDVLYAHDIKAGWVHIDETHAKLKMPKAGGGPGPN